MTINDEFLCSRESEQFNILSRDYDDELDEQVKYIVAMFVEFVLNLSMACTKLRLVEHCFYLEALLEKLQNVSCQAPLFLISSSMRTLTNEEKLFPHVYEFVAHFLNLINPPTLLAILLFILDGHSIA